MKKNFSAIGLASFLAISNLSCGTCDQALQVADLAYTLATIVVPQLAILTPMPLQTIVKNFAPVCKYDATSGASVATQQSIRANYRPDANSAWQDTKISGNDYVVDPIPVLNPANNSDRENRFSFGIPGIYRFALAADHSNLVNESNESNNNANSNNNGTIRAKNTGFQLTVVVTDPTGKVQPNYDPNVQVDITYLGGSPTK